MLLISGTLAAGSISATAAGSDFNLAGLALHQETGRDIYLGGIYFDKQVPKPSDVVGASGPKLMEYRVVARRTSIRSLLGGILLQSEVATGKAPGKATSDLANQLLSNVSGSLYTGDSLEVLLSENDETIAYLNGQEMARVDDGAVSDYLLMGWVGERGPSTAFRNDLMSDEIRPDLLATFTAATYSTERADQVASWIEVQQENLEPAPEADAGSAVAVITEPKPAAEPAVTQTPEPEPVTTDSVNSSAIASIEKQPEATPIAAVKLPELKEPESTPVVADPAEVPGGIQEPIQVASLSPTADILHTTDDSEVQGLGVQEYSQRLSRFHSQLIAMVYGQIRYPARAVRRGLQGRLELDIIMLEDGELVDISIAEPSGHKILDKAAVKAAQSALSSGALAAIDPVAIAEFRNAANNNLIIPVPVQFMLQD